MLLLALTLHLGDPLVRLRPTSPATRGGREPFIRYLRLDPGGRLATDVMLQREFARP